MAALLDWPRIDAWTACIDRGTLGPIADVFRKAGAVPPEAQWDPAGPQLPAEPLRFLRRYWHGLGGKPHLRDIDPFRLKPALGHIILLEPLDGGRDFHVRLYGSIVAQISNVDLTGKKLSDHPASAYTTEFAIAATRAALRRALPLYTTRRPLAAEYTAQWPRLALPFFDDGGAVARILVGTVALDRDGQMIKS